jgi:amino acid transporter
VPLVFVVGLVGVLLVAYGFVRLSQHVNHAGSVYGLAGKTLGPRAGFFCGFALFGVYLVFALSGFGSMALFGITFLEDIGVSGHVPWLPLALGMGVVVYLLTRSNIRVATRVLLVFEGFGIVLIAILIVVILVRTGADTAPHGQRLNLVPLDPTRVTFGALMSASIYAFLSWAGFEGSATLGEETREPRRNIPRAMLLSVAAMGAFFVLTMFAESIGFGTTAAGAHAFGSASAPFSQLSHSYVGSGLASLLDLATTVSAFASGLACAAAASRMLFALARDGFGPSRLGTTSERTGSPIAALVVVLGACVAALVVVALTSADTVTTAQNMYFYAATLGVLGLLVVYAVVSTGAIRFLFITQRRAPIAEIVLPVLGIAYLAFTLYKQVYPVPDSPYDLFPYIAAAWLVLGGVIVALRPRLTRRIGVGLMALDQEPGGEQPDAVVAARAHA